MHASHIFLYCVLYASSIVAAATNNELNEPKVTHRVRTWGEPHAALYDPSNGNVIVAEAHPAIKGHSYHIKSFGRFREPIHCLSQSGAIVALATDTSGKKLALTTDETHIRLHDLENPEEPLVSLYSVSHIAATMTPTADLIAVCALDPQQNIKYLGLCKDNEVSYIPIQRLKNTSDTIIAAALTADGSLFAWGSDQGRVGIKETQEPFEEYAFEAAAVNSMITALAWSPCKKLLAFGLLGGDEMQTPYCGFISVAGKHIIQMWPMQATVATCLFKSRNRLSVSTVKKWLLTYEVPAELHTLEDARPAMKALCDKAAASCEPYEIQTAAEYATFKLLPKELQESWMFVIANHLLRM